MNFRKATPNLKEGYLFQNQNYKQIQEESNNIILDGLSDWEWKE